MNQYGKVAFYTLGCKLNFSETSTLARSFEEAGYAKVDFEERADVYVINTCSVTDNADKKCRYFVKKAKKNNNEAKIIVVGCYAQLKPDEIAQITGVDLVLGANEKFNVVKHLENWNGENSKIFNEPIKETKTFFPAWSSGDRTRTFLKIQDGCNYFCAFCTIPLARGTSRSGSIAETVMEAKKVAATGAKEIVLTGVNIGDFGHGTDENLFGLIQELDKIDEIERYRISSIEPNLLSNEIIEYVSRSKRFVPHFHIPLQSGSDKILESMRRRYKSELYSDRVAAIKKYMPTACIGVDVIVGFPGETEELFNETYQFLQELDISYLHVFTYSERPNTTAIRLEDVVPKNVRETRSKMLRILSTKKKRKFYNDFVGKNATVLFESEQENNLMSGFTNNYLKVVIPYHKEYINKLIDVKLEKINSDGFLEGKVLIPIAI